MPGRRKSDPISSRFDGLSSLDGLDFLGFKYNLSQKTWHFTINRFKEIVTISSSWNANDVECFMKFIPFGHLLSRSPAKREEGEESYFL